VQQDPHRRAGARAAAGESDSLFVDVPLAGLRAEELHGPGRVVDGRRERGHAGQAIVDRGIRNALRQPRPNRRRSLFLVAADPASSVNGDQERSRTGTVGFPKIKHVPLVRTVRHVRIRGRQRLHIGRDDAKRRGKSENDDDDEGFHAVSLIGFIKDRRRKPSESDTVSSENVAANSKGRTAICAPRTGTL
jgi:hypothetical protein